MMNSCRISSERAWRGESHGARSRATGAGIALLAGLLLGFGPAGRVAAQAPGSVQGGPNRPATTPDRGPANSRPPGALPNTSFRPGASNAASGRTPYGQMNFGRDPALEEPGAPPDLQEVGFADGPFRSSQWSGLIDQNFRIMRRTSPFPHQFAGGMFNRGPFVHRFGPAAFGFFNPSFGAFSYGGYAFDYGSPLYGGYVPSVYSLYGSWYPPYLPQDRVYIIERDVVRDRAEPDTHAEDREDAGASEKRSQPDASEKRSSADEGGYYLAPHLGETLDEAIAEIRHAWMNGDYARLKSRLPEKGRVRIYLKGKYKYAVDAPDFAQMTQDAMKRIDTTSFTLDRVKRLSDDRAFASGEHVYYDPDHVKHEVYVSYGLSRENGRWKITEAGSSTEPIGSHSGD
jgi:hypothetical protein